MRHLVSWALGRRLRIRIAGASMSPTFLPGDEVLVDPRAYRSRGPSAGDVVLARHPLRDARIVKRITRITPDGCYFVEGDNPDHLESTDSRAFGPLAPGRILGRVVRKLPW